MKPSALDAVLPPPPSPIGARGPSDWAAAKAVFGHDFPPAYKQIVDRYGAPCIGGKLWIVSPFAKDPALLFGRVSLEVLDALAEQLGSPGRRINSAAFRRPGYERAIDAFDARVAALAPLARWDESWHPWALASDGSILFFAAKGAASGWPTLHFVPYAPERPPPRKIDAPADQILAELITGRLELSEGLRGIEPTLSEAPHRAPARPPLAEVPMGGLKMIDLEGGGKKR